MSSSTLQAEDGEIIEHSSDEQSAPSTPASTSVLDRTGRKRRPSSGDVASDAVANQVKTNNLIERLSSPSDPSLNASNSPAKIRKLSHTDIASSSDSLKSLAPESSSRSRSSARESPDFDDHHSNSDRSTHRRSDSRDRSSRREHSERSSHRRYDSDRSRRSRSPSVSSRRDGRRDSSRDGRYGERGYDREHSSRSRSDYRSSHPILTSGRQHDSHADSRNYDRELERYSRETSHRRQESFSKDLGREKDNNLSSRAREPVSVDIKPMEVVKARSTASTLPPKPELVQKAVPTPKPPLTEDVDIPIFVEEQDEEALREERRRKRQAILNKLKVSTPTTPDTPNTPAPATPASPASPDTSRFSTPVLAFTLEGIRMTDASAPESDISRPGSPIDEREDRPLHKSVATLKSTQDSEILKSKDSHENLASGTSTEQEMSAADYHETAPNLPKQPALQQTKDSAEFDMFGDMEDDMFDLATGTDIELKPAKDVSATSDAYAPELVDNWDDAEGYYRFGHGELLDSRYMVMNVLGRGVFSSVVKARDTQNGDMEVAIKILRSNETMYKAGKRELDILKRLMENDPHNRKHVIRLLRHFEHRGHLCLVFESLSMNLREVLKKFGKDVGLNINAVRIYAQQLFLSLSLLRKSSILHADIKPDNILVNEAKNVLKLCDLGSASDTTENEITPYLVSRFYRAPEIILGMPYDTALDMWSIGCTLYELFTGKILFPGRSNNQMLKHMMDLKGPFSKKMIRKGQFNGNHFDEHCNFLSVEIEKVSQRDVVRTIQVTKPTKDLKARLMPYTTKMSPADVVQVNHFVNLLEKALHLNPEHRITPEEALHHPFIKRE